MGSVADIHARIVEIMKTSSLGLTVVFVGEPPKSRYPDFPWGWCEWIGGPMEAPVGSKQEIINRFYLVVICRNTDFEAAETELQDKLVALENLLDDDPTLNGKVAASFVSMREKDKVFDVEDYSIVAGRLTLYTWRKE